jgi:putative flippase GtrA
MAKSDVRFTGKTDKMTLTQRLTRLIDWFYRRPFTALMPRQTFRYLACGGINFVISTLVHWVAFNHVFDKRNLDLCVVVVSPHIASLGAGWVISVLVGFWMQKNVSFRSSPLRGRIQLFRYFVSAAAILALSYGLDKLFVETCRIFPTVALMMVYLITATLGFIVQKHYAFRGAAKE